jgi:membrane-associated protease RseP (regulator of RpoE activity)
MGASNIEILGIFGAITFFVGIVVHELGHLLVARFLGIEVSGVTIGFGPKIISYTDRYGVRWTFAPLLIGAFCSFRELGGENTDPGNKLRTFSEASLKDRAIVLLGGPAFNLCFAGLVWLIILFRKSILPFIPEYEVVYGLPAFLVLGSVLIALGNLLPIPPLDGGHLLLVAFEALRGRALTNEKHLIRVGVWVITLVTVVASVLLLRILSGVGPLL